MESTKKYLRITGFGYLIIFITGFFSNFFVLESMIVSGDAAVTFTNIASNEMMFRYGILGFLVMVIADLLLAWTLYLILKPVNKNISLLSSWLRLVNAVIFGVALTNLLNILQQVNNPELTELSGANQIYSQIVMALGSFNYTWLIGLVFFGVHLLFLGYLVIRADFIPTIIGVLLVVAGAGYLVDSFAQFVMPDYNSHRDIFQMIVMLPGVVGEFSFTVWLLIKGFKK